MADQDPKALLLEGLRAMLGDDRDLGFMDDALPGLSELVSAFAAPDFECLMVPLPPTPPTAYPGRHGLLEAWRDWGEAFPKVRVQVEEIREGDDSVAVLIEQVATTRHQGVEMRRPSGMVIAFEAGRVKRIEFHLDRDEALRSAGLG